MTDRWNFWGMAHSMVTWASWGGAARREITQAKVKHRSWSVHAHATTELADASFAPRATEPTCGGAEEGQGAGPNGGLAGVSLRLQSIEGSSEHNRACSRPESECNDADFSAEGHPPSMQTGERHIGPRGGTLGCCGSDSTRSPRASLEKAPLRPQQGLRGARARAQLPEAGRGAAGRRDPSGRCSPLQPVPFPRRRGGERAGSWFPRRAARSRTEPSAAAEGGCSRPGAGGA